MNSSNRVLNRTDNQGFIKGIFSVAIIGLGVFAIISFAMPYYRHNVLTSYAGSIVEAERVNIQKIRERVMTSAGELKVPLDDENLSVRYSDDKIILQASWSEVVDFWGFYQKTLHFNINIEQ